LFDEYVGLYGARLFGLCLKLCAHRQDAEDLYQETWYKAYKNFDKYDPARGVEGWLTTICVNAYRDTLRRQKWRGLLVRFGTTEQQDLALANIPEPVPPDYTDVHEAVQALPGKYRTVIVLYYFNGLDVAQTARALGLPVGTVKYQLHRARELLKRRLEEDG